LSNFAMCWQVCSKKVLCGLFERYTDLVKIAAACSLDPQLARIGNTETIYAVPMKLDCCYIKSLYMMGLVPWKSFGDVLKHSIYNMDEVGTGDTTKHRPKINVDALSMIQNFQLAPEGDARMNSMHILACITTTSDGKFLLCLKEYELLCFWLLIIPFSISCRNLPRCDARLYSSMMALGTTQMGIHVYS
jgi:hypothetical protein